MVCGGLLNDVAAAEECDATEAEQKYRSRLQKNKALQLQGLMKIINRYSI